MSSAGNFVLLALLALSMGACASPRMPSKQFSVDIAAYNAEMAAMPIAAPPPVISDIGLLRASLPSFDIRRGEAGAARRQEVSVVRDISFAADSSILSRRGVARLVPLQNYLRKNPLIAVRIEGYGDTTSPTERNAKLSQDRAQTAARALLANIAVTNMIVARGAAAPQSNLRVVEITLINESGSAW